MNHRRWFIDLVLMFRLATAKADEPQGLTTLKLDHCDHDPNGIEKVFQKDLLDGVACVPNPAEECLA
jgi:hypothetical protein